MKALSLTVAPTSLREYATARGWVQLREALKDGLVVLNHEKYKPKQIVYPTNSGDPGYSDSVGIALARLAELEGKQIGELVSDVRRVHEDTYRFRLFDDRGDDESIPYHFALSALKGSEQMLVSAISTVVLPRVFHPRLGGMKEAQRFLEEARFNHTEHGSFVLNVSCPVNALDKGGDKDLFSSELPFVRKASMALTTGLQQIVTSIEEGTVQQLVERVSKEQKPLISTNLAGALDYFVHDDSKHSLEVRVDWAGSLPGPSMGKPAVVTIQRDYFPLIRDIREALRPKKVIEPEEYIGTVETLNGDPGPDGRREGEVILRIQLRDSDELIRARVVLNADLYDEAMNAHRTENAYIAVKGKLQDGRQPRSLNEVTHFARLADQG